MPVPMEAVVNVGGVGEVEDDDDDIDGMQIDCIVPGELQMVGYLVPTSGALASTAFHSPPPLPFVCI